MKTRSIFCLWESFPRRSSWSVNAHVDLSWKCFFFWASSGRQGKSFGTREEFVGHVEPKQQFVSHFLIHFKLWPYRVDCFYANILIQLKSCHFIPFLLMFSCLPKELSREWSLTFFFFLHVDMVYLEEAKATCRVLDQHPNPAQRKLSFLVAPDTTTVKQFLEQVSTQFIYDNFELILETKNVRQEIFHQFRFSCC